MVHSLTRRAAAVPVTRRVTVPIGRGASGRLESGRAGRGAAAGPHGPVRAHRGAAAGPHGPVRAHRGTAAARMARSGRTAAGPRDPVRFT